MKSLLAGIIALAAASPMPTVPVPPILNLPELTTPDPIIIPHEKPGSGTITISPLGNTFIYTRDGDGFWVTVSADDDELDSAHTICQDHQSEHDWAGICLIIENKWVYSGARDRWAKIKQQKIDHEKAFVEKTAAK